MKSEKDINSFVFETEDGRKINCEILLSFYVRDKEKQYVLFTDNEKNESGELNVYAYYINENDETWYPIEDKNEFNMVEEIYNNVLKRVNE